MYLFALKFEVTFRLFLSQSTGKVGSEIMWSSRQLSRVAGSYWKPCFEKALKQALGSTKRSVLLSHIVLIRFIISLCMPILAWAVTSNLNDNGVKSKTKTTGSFNPSITFLSLAFCFAVDCFFFTLTELCSQQLHCKSWNGCHINISSLFNVGKLENLWQGCKINKHMLYKSINFKKNE